MADLDFRVFLREILKQRQQKNPAYSMTAFARDLQMSPQKLSQVLKGNLGLSINAAQETAKLLELDAENEELFVSLVGRSHARSHELKRHYAEKVRHLTSLKSADQRPPEEFEPLSDALSWTCFLLVDTADFRYDFDWIAKRTGATVDDCRAAFARLENSDLIRCNADGKWSQNSPLIQYAFPTSGPDIRKFYSTMISRANEAVERAPYEQRHNHVLMLPVSVEDYAEMKKKIDDFAQSLLGEYSNRSAGATRVYACNINLFPLDQEPTP